MTTRRLHACSLALLALLLLLVHPALAQTLTGRVVGVADGDTITLLTAEKKQVKVRLNGIDCPESHQAFGTAAKQFTSKKVFGKDIAVRTQGTDRYGRTLGDIIAED